MVARASIQGLSRRWGGRSRSLVGWACVAAVLLVAGPSAAKQSLEPVKTAPVVLLSEGSRGAEDVAKAVATALGNPADLRRWTLSFSSPMTPGIRVYANGHDPKPILDRLGAAGLKAAVSDRPVGVPYSVLTSSKDRIFLIIGPTP